MPVYGYRALQKDSKRYQGWITAPNLEEAKRQLRQLQIPVLSLWPQTTARLHVSKKQIAQLFHHLAILRRAGFPLYEALCSLQESESSSSLRLLLLSLSDQIQTGASLEQSLRSFPELFDPSLLAMIQAGERGADLVTVLERSSKILLTQERLKGEIVSALIYPALLSFVGIALVLLMLLFVVPSLEPLFENAPSDSATTLFVFASSRFLLAHGGKLLLFSSLLFSLSLFFFLRGRTGFSRDWTFLPLVGPLLVKAEIARFGFVMQALLESGVALVDALEIVSALFKNRNFRQKLEKAKERVLQGQSLSQALEGSSMPSLVLKLIALGERSGSLGPSFEHLRQIMDEELQKDLTRLTVAAQPIILLVMGLLVGLIMAAILIPLTDMGRLQGV